MDKLTFAAFEERLGSLERECLSLRWANRHWRRAGLLIAMVGVAGLLIGANRRADQPKTIEAESFVIKDDDGKIYAELGLYRGDDGRTTGATRLAFFDGAGTLRTNYGVGSAHDPYLHLLDSDGQMLGSLGMTARGWTNLEFREKSGKTAVSIGSSNASGVVLYGPDGKGGLPQHEGALIVQADGSAMLHFFRPGTSAGDDRHERVRLGVRPDGTSALELRGADFNAGIRAALSPKGKARLTVDGSDAP